MEGADRGIRQRSQHSQFLGGNSIAMNSALPRSISQLQLHWPWAPDKGGSTSGQSGTTRPFLASSSLAPLTQVFSRLHFGRVKPHLWSQEVRTLGPLFPGTFQAANMTQLCGNIAMCKSQLHALAHPEYFWDSRVFVFLLWF